MFLVKMIGNAMCRRNGGKSKEITEQIEELRELYNRKDRLFNKYITIKKEGTSFIAYTKGLN
jgi:hypothetical protein